MVSVSPPWWTKRTWGLGERCYLGLRGRNETRKRLNAYCRHQPASAEVIFAVSGQIRRSVTNINVTPGRS